MSQASHGEPWGQVPWLILDLLLMGHGDGTRNLSPCPIVLNAAVAQESDDDEACPGMGADHRSGIADHDILVALFS